MGRAVTPWIHIVAVAIWLGPQFFMFLVMAPALRTIEDADARVRVMRVITTRFAWLAWAAMVVIVLSGISNLFQEGADADISLGSADYRYFHIFSLKMMLVGVTVLLTATHTFIVGPRQLRLAEEMRSDSEEARRLRRVSMAISGVSLLVSVAVVFVAALLANHDYSFQPT